MGFVQDVRFALRVLARKPAFTLVVVFTLALGIGAGSAMYSIIDALLVRPLDLPELDRLAVIQESTGGQEFQPDVAPRSFLDYRADAQSFENVVAYQYWEVALTGNGDPENVIGDQVSPGFFDTLGVKPLLGRWFAADEVDGRRDKVVVLSHALWDRRYARDGAIVGKSISLDGASYTVVGVMPRGFHVPNATDFWAPLTLTPEQRQDRRSQFLGVIAKLKPGVSLAAADAEMRQMGERHAALYPENKMRALRVVSLVRGVTEDYTRNFIFTLLGAAIFVLLIACANVANLFLAHALARRKELAVRAALGAGRRRIVRQLLTEAAVLGVVGGLLSLLFASWGVDLIKSAMPLRIVRFIAGWDNMGVNGAVLAFALGVGILVGFVFGVVPAWQVSRADVNTVLKDGDRGTTGGRHTHRLRAVLVVLQVAFAVIMLIGAGAMMKGFIRMAHPAEWLDGGNVLTLHVSLPEARYRERKDTVEFARAVVDRMRAAPGVRSAAATNNVPWGNHGWGRTPYPEGRVTRPEDEVHVDYRYVTPGYRELLRIPRVEGRDFGDGDTATSPRVAIVSAHAAARLWPGESSLGKRFRWQQDDKSPWITVVGVIGDIHDRPDERGPPPVIYVPFAQEAYPSMYFVVRTDVEPLALARAVASAVYAVDPAQPVAQIRTLDLVLAERLAGFRIGAWMMGIFALLALVLAAVGIYGVVATLVTQRTHEIGVRMALGAQRGDVLRLILRRGVLLTMLGLVPGVAIAVVVLRIISSVLTGIIDNDLIVFVAFTSVVAGIATFGSFVPAWRATKVDPLVALREE
ncbi:MAG TPA: ABC transporter permease [Haliangiales bacterium]|nr:ABC transporter permease [Haliangiales bacterium]